MRELTEKDLEILAGSRLFHAVELELVEHLLEDCSVRALEKGEVLLAEGRRASDSVFLVLEGNVSVHLGGKSADPYTVFGTGESVGEMSVIDGRPISATVVADEPTRVLAIPESILWSLVNTSHQMARNLLLALSLRMRHDNGALVASIEQQRELEQAASTDGLTGLRNRRWMNQAFRREIDRCARDRKPVSMILADLDNLKLANDRGGHLAGDAVICRVASVLLRNLRPMDLLARYAGDEFCLLLPGTNEVAARRVAERLRDAVDQEVHIDLGCGPIRATISLGVGSGPYDTTLDELFRGADASLYRAKEAGRNRVGS
ncbi:MAG TPA: GGDEF domain-containing protein [Burkholderiales bacterium]